MIIKLQIANDKIILRESPQVHWLLSLTEAFNKISELFLEDRELKVQVDIQEPKIFIERYAGKKISKVQLEYLVKIISARTERRAYIKIMCKWLNENSIRWEKI